MLLKTAGCVLALAVLIQFVPFGHTHLNPPVTKEPAWDSPRTRSLFERACFDCHSNHTGWRWYSYIAPVSWLVANDVNGGRSHLNFSEWNRVQKHAQDIQAQVEAGDMPPWFYLPLHSAARLRDDERQALIDGAVKTFGTQAPAQTR